MDGEDMSTARLHATPRGIDGLKGKEPIGAVLTIGEKGPGRDNKPGSPISRDRLFWRLPQEVDGVRPRHPKFRSWNEHGDPRQGDKPGDAKARAAALRSVQGIIVHGERDSFFEHSLHCQAVKGKPSHPAGMPFCRGDGKRAVRYLGEGKGDDGSGFAEIACPADACEFRQEANGKVMCKPFARLLFRPHWPDGQERPTPLTKWTTHSWNSVRALLGLVEYVEAQAAALGVPEWSFYGLRFEMTLAEKTNKQRKSRFPIVVFSALDDVQSWLMAQHAQRRQLAEGRPVVAALIDGDQQSGPELKADHDTIVPGRPGAAPAPVEAEIVDDDSDEPEVDDSEDESTGPPTCPGCNVEMKEGRGGKLFCPDCGLNEAQLDEAAKQGGLFQ